MKICIDSRKVEPGDIFYCLEGVVTDGHKFADMAAEKGASVIVYQNDLPTEERDGVAYIRVKDTVAALNEACDSFYGHPSHKLKMFGVTGTNGKSTITNIIAQIYSKKRALRIYRNNQYEAWKCGEGAGSYNTGLCNHAHGIKADVG